MKIMIVDDSDEDRRLLRYIAERQGHEVHEAENGLEGIRVATAIRPDLIISDALMPVMDGFRFLRAVKADEALRTIPFIFYSAAYRGQKDVDLALAIGANRYLIKPMEPKELWREVEATLNSCRETVAAAPGLVAEEEEYLRKYSEIVVAKLEQKIRELEEANIALKVLLERNRSAESELREKMLANIESLTLPYLNQLEHYVTPEEGHSYLKLLKKSIKELATSFSGKLSAPILGLSPREIQIADLIRSGMSNKEIAHLLCLAVGTVEFYRDRIRNKLDLKNRKTNLRSYLNEQFRE